MINENWRKLAEEHGLRQPKNQFQRVLLWFKEMGWARRILGGTWALVQLDQSYKCWMWALDGADWLKSETHKIYVIEMYRVTLRVGKPE